MNYKDWLQTHCRQKVVSAAKAISKIKRGSRVFIGTGCGEPQYLIQTMVNDRNMQDIMVYQMLSSTLSKYIDQESFQRRFSVKLFFISRSMRKAAFEGKIDYVPAYLSQIPGLFSSHRIGLDVALIQVSPPDKFGYCSLGVSVDITLSGMENAGLVVAQVNPRMPRTWGDSFVHVDDIDYLVDYEEPLVEAFPALKDNQVTMRIGHFVSQLIDDGATLQIGFGSLPNAILQYLDKKKDWEFTPTGDDVMVPLIKKGVSTPKKVPSARRIVPLCSWERRPHRFGTTIPFLFSNRLNVVNDPLQMRRNDNSFRSVRLEVVDRAGLFGSTGYLFYSGIGDQ
jgi:acyl-CoA hydrolase